MLKKICGMFSLNEFNSLYNSLITLMNKRSAKVLREFKKVALSDVKDRMLLKVINDVIVYWKDSFRPSLTRFSSEAVGGHSEFIDELSLMITLTSAGGGLHDDIIDKSLNKHFRMTILGLHGLEYALLAGDLLILKGWMVAKKIVKKINDPKKLFDILSFFGDWTINVCEAEFMEISCRRNLDTPLKTYELILRKSMADIEGCTKLGAILGEGSPHEIHALANFGSCLGYMYRLLDDIKDTLNKEFNLKDRLGKESVPLPILFAAKYSKNNYSQINAIINSSILTSTELTKIIELCFESKSFNYINNLAKINREKAQEMLQRLEPTKDDSVMLARTRLELLIEKPYKEIQNYNF